MPIRNKYTSGSSLLGLAAQEGYGRARRYREETEEDRRRFEAQMRARRESEIFQAQQAAQARQAGYRQQEKMFGLQTAAQQERDLLGADIQRERDIFAQEGRMDYLGQQQDFTREQLALKQENSLYDLGANMLRVFPAGSPEYDKFYSKIKGVLGAPNATLKDKTLALANLEPELRAAMKLQKQKEPTPIEKLLPQLRQYSPDMAYQVEAGLLSPIFDESGNVTKYFETPKSQKIREDRAAAEKSKEEKLNRESAERIAGVKEAEKQQQEIRKQEQEREKYIVARANAIIASAEKNQTEVPDRKRAMVMAGREYDDIQEYLGKIEPPLDNYLVNGFDQWYANMAAKTGINPNPYDPRHKYDYRAAYEAGVEPQMGQDGQYHWPSQFKADDHPNRFIDGVDTKTEQQQPKLSSFGYMATNPQEESGIVAILKPEYDRLEKANRAKNAKEYYEAEVRLSSIIERLKRDGKIREQ